MSLIAGRYQIIAPIGEGGMQEVFQAEDTLLRKHVALKRAKNSSAERRFKRSAVLSARVNHPNVAKTLDYVEEGGSLYLVEELIIGADLAQVGIEQLRAMDPLLAARIMHHVAKGLTVSHAAGVVHRDLKPSNIMVEGGLSFSGIKITDFGIARMAGEEVVEAVEGGDASLTASKTVVGALPYMAPEVIDTPRNISPPADVWSLGAMTYELLTRRKPFGSGLRAVPAIVAGQHPGWGVMPRANAQFAPLLGDIKGIVDKCLQKDSESRPSAAQLSEACSQLCYAVEPRRVGIVTTIKYQAFGFIHEDNGDDVFFHMENVFGDRPKVGDRVHFAKFLGGGAWRAFPVSKLA